MRPSSDGRIKHPARGPTEVGHHAARLLIVSKSYYLDNPTPELD